jgi:hypothetical protein
MDSNEINMANTTTISFCLFKIITTDRHFIISFFIRISRMK